MTVSQPIGDLPGVSLEVRGVSKSFAGLEALRDVSMVVEPGNLVGLIGPNGAGKTTLFNCATGLIGLESGSMWLGNTRLDGRRPEQIARLGVVRTFQNLRMFPRLTVFESLLAARFIHRKSSSGLQVLANQSTASSGNLSRSQRSAAAERALDVLSLEQVANEPCVDLGLLVQRKVELGRALMAEPRVLLLDEPSAGATEKESDELREIVQAVSQAGVSILLVEHNIPFVMGLAKKIVALNFGQVIATGTPQAIRNDPQVRKVYLGT